MKTPVRFDIGWNACINCGACIAVCPQPPGFISDFDTIAVDTTCTIACMKCEEVCPVSTISHRLVDMAGEMEDRKMKKVKKKKDKKDKKEKKKKKKNKSE